MDKGEGLQQRIYDLEERTALFGEQVIRFARMVPTDSVTDPLIRQVVRSGTSVGANYCEASDCDTGKEFRHKVGICRREAKETRHWIRMIVSAVPALRDDGRPLWQEAKELTLIFAAMKRGKRRTSPIET